MQSGRRRPRRQPSTDQRASGTGEGKVTVLAWPGYVGGRHDRPGVDWVSSFETETGCKVTVQTFGTSDEAFTLFQTNPEQYDVISASGDATLRLVAGGFVQPVNSTLIPSYAEIFEDLKDKDYNTVDGVHYGVPHGRGANVLMWRTDEVTTAPTSWSGDLRSGVRRTPASSPCTTPRSTSPTRPCS